MEVGYIRKIDQIFENAVTQSTNVLDLRGLKCPLPVLKTNKALENLAIGDEIWVETTDPLAVIDIPTFVAEKGHTLIEQQELPDHARFLLRKGG